MSIRRKGQPAAPAFLLTAILATAPTAAGAFTLTTYAVTFDEDNALVCPDFCNFPDSPPIMDLAIFESFPGEGEALTAWGAFGNNVPTDPGVTTDIESSSIPYLNAPSQALLIGWLENLPSDPLSEEGIGHLVIGMNTQAAINIADVPFSQVFPGVLADSLIAALVDLDEGGDTAALAAGLLFDFVTNSAAAGNLGPNGTPGSALFTPVDGGGFSMVVFSNAQTIGSGVITVEPAVVPLPGAAWLLLTGLGALGLRRRIGPHGADAN